MGRPFSFHMRTYSGQAGGGAFETVPFWSYDLQQVVRVRSNATKHLLVIETVQAEPTQLRITQSSMRHRPTTSLHAYAILPDKSFLSLPYLWADSGITCWQTNAGTFSFRRNKARVRLDWNTRHGKCKPVTGPRNSQLTFLCQFPRKLCRRRKTPSGKLLPNTTPTLPVETLRPTSSTLLIQPATWPLKNGLPIIQMVWQYDESSHRYLLTPTLFIPPPKPNAR